MAFKPLPHMPFELGASKFMTLYAEYLPPGKISKLPSDLKIHFEKYLNEFPERTEADKEGIFQNYAVNFKKEQVKLQRCKEAVESCREAHLAITKMCTELKKADPTQEDSWIRLTKKWKTLSRSFELDLLFLEQQGGWLPEYKSFKERGVGIAKSIQIQNRYNSIKGKRVMALKRLKGAGPAIAEKSRELRNSEPRQTDSWSKLTKQWHDLTKQFAMDLQLLESGEDAPAYRSYIASARDIQRKIKERNRDIESRQAKSDKALADAESKREKKQNRVEKEEKDKKMRQLNIEERKQGVKKKEAFETLEKAKKDLLRMARNQYIQSDQKGDWEGRVHAYRAAKGDAILAGISRDLIKDSSVTRAVSWQDQNIEYLTYTRNIMKRFFAISNNKFPRPVDLMNLKGLRDEYDLYGEYLTDPAKARRASDRGKMDAAISAMSEKLEDPSKARRAGGRGKMETAIPTMPKKLEKNAQVTDSGGKEFQLSQHVDPLAGNFERIVQEIIDSDENPRGYDENHVALTLGKATYTFPAEGVYADTAKSSYVWFDESGYLWLVVTGPSGNAWLSGLSVEGNSQVIVGTNTAVSYENVPKFY